MTAAERQAEIADALAQIRLLLGEQQNVLCDMAWAVDTIVSTCEHVYAVSTKEDEQ